MTTTLSTAFERAIHRFRQSLTEEQKKTFAASSEDDVEDEIQKIQQRFGSAKKLRSLSRLSKFLEAMSQIEQLAQIFLNVSNVVAFVWGPIKFALLVAGARLDTLECLLDTYVEIGEVSPSLRQYDQLFKTAPQVLEVLERYFCDILEFHRNALEVFSSPGWKIFFDSAWKTFKTRFKPILESLKRHKALLLDERLNAAVMEIQSNRTQIVGVLDKSADQSTKQINHLEQQVQEIFTKLSKQIYGLHQSVKKNEEWQRNSSMQEISAIRSKLEPPEYEADQQSASNLCHPESGQWIFENPTFIKWEQSKEATDSVMFIHGMPGSGKTLMASNIIRKLRSETGSYHTTCLFFYFKHSDDAKRSMAGMLRALLVQLVHQDSTLVPAFHAKCSILSDSETRQLTNLKTWTIELLKSQNTCTIILDGLDECCHHTGNGGARKILEWFLLSVIPDCQREGVIIRLLVLGQRDGDLDEILSDYPSIRLETAISHSNDLRSFARMRASEISQRFSLHSEVESKIVDQVTKTAKGMFLYAKVVLDNLLAQGSEAELEEELRTEFPPGLNQAYERVIARILDCQSRPEKKREAALKILRWLTCAVRPLRWNELQCLFCIDPHSGLCNPKNRRVDSCKNLCGSFVEAVDIDPKVPQSLMTNPVVSLVHETARQYLIQAGHVDLLEENARMTIWSSAYLASSPFSEATDNSFTHGMAFAGYYGLEDYVMSSFQTHLHLSFKQSADLSPITLRSLRQMLCALITRLGLDDSFDVDLSSLDCIQACLKDSDDTALTRRLEKISAAIRNVIEDVDVTMLDGRTKNIFHSLNGAPQYKCSRLGCLYFSRAFDDKKSRDHHVFQHENQFTCSADGCPRLAIGFLSSLDLQKHTQKEHTNPQQQLPLFPSLKISKDIWSAYARGDLEYVKRFHAAGGDLRAPKRKNGHLTPIFLAARNGHFELCQYLALNGAYAFMSNSINLTNFSVLGEAIRTRNSKLFKTLLSSTTEAVMDEFINGPDFCPHILTAVNTGIRDFLELLLEMNSKRRESLSTFEILGKLCRCPAIHSPEAIVLLEEIFSLLSIEEANKFLNEKDYDSTTHLYWACVYQNENAVDFLLRRMEETQDIYYATKCHNSPIVQGIRKCNTTIIRLLVEHDSVGATAVCDPNNNTPLHLACVQGKTDIFELLLPYSLDYMNKGNKEGNTPLHLAVIANPPKFIPSTKIVKALLKTRAIDLSTRNHKGQTVFNICIDPEIRILLSSVKPSRSYYQNALFEMENVTTDQLSQTDI